MEPHDAGGFGRLGKRVAPALARVANMQRTRNPTRLLAIYLDILQGKGSGTGWDMTGEVSAALAFLRDVADPVIVDIGANEGEWTRGIWQELHRGRYYAYEPQQACGARLTNLPVPGLTLIQSAVSDRVGQINLYSDFAGSGLASFYQRAETYFDSPTQVELVPVTIVDEELKAQGLDHVDFMKIDVEGAELQVLKGAQHSLQTRAIHSFSFEFGSANIYSRVFFREIWDIVADHSYSLWRIAPGGRLIPIPAYREDLEHFRGVSNYIASVDSIDANR
jgi:FkbM family methyltransferase